MKERTVFIIPGYAQTPKNRAYTKISKILSKQGYIPQLVNISWEKNSFSKNTQLFLRQYKKVKTRKKYILGFSFGAMIAFVASTKVSPSGLVLCSLSPYFSEDLSEKLKEKYKDFSKLNNKKLSKKIKAKKVLMLYGTREEKSLKQRVNKTYKQISKRKKYLFPINKTEHNIGDLRYLNKIYQITKVLN